MPFRDWSWSNRNGSCVYQDQCQCSCQMSDRTFWAHHCSKSANHRHNGPVDSVKISVDQPSFPCMSVILFIPALAISLFMFTLGETSVMMTCFWSSAVGGFESKMALKKIHSFSDEIVRRFDDDPTTDCTGDQLIWKAQRRSRVNLIFFRSVSSVNTRYCSLPKTEDYWGKNNLLSGVLLVAESSQWRFAWPVSEKSRPGLAPSLIEMLSHIKLLLVIDACANEFH